MDRGGDGASSRLTERREVYDLDGRGSAVTRPGQLSLMPAVNSVPIATVNALLAAATPSHRCPLLRLLDVHGIEEGVEVWQPNEP